MAHTHFNEEKSMKETELDFRDGLSFSVSPSFSPLHSLVR
jgi:hypothetical protein